jgi:hypothetical protein
MWLRDDGSNNVEFEHGLMGGVENIPYVNHYHEGIYS